MKRKQYEVPVSKHIKMEQALSDKLDQLAIKLDRNVTWLVNRAIEEYIKKN